jgi:hypothetical protein
VADVAELASLLAPFGSVAATGSLERILKVAAPTSSPNITSSGRISIRDPSSSSNPILVHAEGVARTEVAWDTLRDVPPTPAKKAPRYALFASIGTGLVAGVGVLAFVLLSQKRPLPPPPVGGPVASETAATPTASSSTSASATDPPDAATVTADSRPDPAPTVSQKPRPPKPPPSARPPAVVPAVTVPAPKPSAPTGVTLDRHG